MFNCSQHRLNSERTNEFLLGAAPCRSGADWLYRPCPSSMAGRIEVAEGGRNLRGNGGERRRSRPSCITVEGDHRMRGNDPWPPLVTLAPEGSAVGTRYFLERLARGRHTRGQPGRQARRASRSISYRIPQSVRCKAQEARGGLSVPSPHPFPKAPVLLQDWCRKRLMRRFRYTVIQ